MNHLFQIFKYITGRTLRKCPQDRVLSHNLIYLCKVIGATEPSVALYYFVCKQGKVFLPTLENDLNLIDRYSKQEIKYQNPRVPMFATVSQVKTIYETIGEHCISEYCIKLYNKR